MSSPVRIETTTAVLARACGLDLAAFNVGCYHGTSIPRRHMTGAELVTVIGTTAHAVVKTPETWIEDRFESLGARQIKRLRAMVSS